GLAVEARVELVGDGAARRVAGVAAADRGGVVHLGAEGGLVVGRVDQVAVVVVDRGTGGGGGLVDRERFAAGVGGGEVAVAAVGGGEVVVAALQGAGLARVGDAAVTVEGLGVAAADRVGGLAVEARVELVGD